MLTPEDKLSLYRYLRQTRLFEDWIYYICHNQNPQKPVIIGKGYLSTGQEAISVGATYALTAADWFAPSHRDIGGHLVRGMTLRELILQYMSRQGSPSKGRDGNVHFGFPRYNTLGFISHMGALATAANGVAFAMQYRKEPNAVLCCFGDGAAQQGAVHEAFNYAAVFKLPVVFVINNNRWAISTPVSEQMAVENLADRAVGYGIPSAICEGNDVFAVHEQVAKALTRARSGNGPTIIECKSMRMAGHGTHDMAKYVSDEEFAFWKKKDPIAWAERTLVEEGLADAAYFTELGQKLKAEIDQQVDELIDAPAIVPDHELEDVFAVRKNDDA
jgi:TPP-dependent pyruvate/acetoin dehydrogenase alpha subunit